MNTSSRRRERPSRLLRGTHAFLGCVAAFFLLASQVAAQNAAGLPEPLRGPPPVWAEPLPAPAVSTARSVGGFRILLNEQQLRFDAQGQHTYMRTVVHVQSAAGLRAASTISVSWLPAYQTLTLNSVTIRRGDEVIEALPFAQIEVLRREENLEFATLNGALTAVMQVAGVRVGDVLDIAYTLSTRVPVLGEHHELTTGVTNLLAMDRGRLRASWPADQNIRVRATAPWTTPEPRRRGDDIFVEIDENDVRILNIPQDAPPRYQLTRQLDFTDYADWDAVARLMAPLYAEAAILAPDSPLHAEVERIRAAWATPEEQALAALRLVQDEVRYVALAMGEAGLVPAGADETWRLRYGDCKGKTALLLALLRALGVEAEAALVSTVLGDGLSQRLPMVGAFDHVIVRAVIDGRVVWLDGTRMGDRRLDTPLTFGWALALDTGGDLQRIEVTPLATPLYESSLRVDASEGMLVPARISGSIIMRGDYALMMEDGLSSLTETGAGEFRQAMAKAMVPGLIVETVDSDYDAESNQFRITLTGTAPLDWRASGAGEAALYSVPLSAPGMQIGMNRASGPYADLPVTVNYPVYARQYVEVALPGDGAGFSVMGDSLEEEIAGHLIRRDVVADGALVSVDVSMWSLTAEVPAETVRSTAPRLRELAADQVRIAAPRDYQATVADRRALTARSPTTSADHLEQGRLLVASGEIAAGLAAMDQAVALDAENAEAYALRGLTHMLNMHYDAAETDFERALDIDPSNAAALSGRAGLSMEQFRYDDAVLDYSRLLRVTGRTPETLMGRAIAYFSLGDDARALADLDAALAMADAGLRWSITSLRARVLSSLGRFDEGIQSLSTLLTGGAEDLGLLYDMAEFALDDDRPEVAETHIAAAMALEEEAESRLYLRLLEGRARLALGDTEAAAAIFADVRAGAAEDASMLNNLCWAQGTRGFALDLALADCEAALALEPTSSAIIDSRAMVHLQAGRFAEAAADYEAALALEPDQLSSRYGLGLARIALGQEAEGRADTAAALAINRWVGREYRFYEAARADR